MLRVRPARFGHEKCNAREENFQPSILPLKNAIYHFLQLVYKRVYFQTAVSWTLNLCPTKYCSASVSFLMCSAPHARFRFVPLLERNLSDITSHARLSSWALGHYLICCLILRIKLSKRNTKGQRTLLNEM